MAQLGPEWHGSAVLTRLVLGLTRRGAVVKGTAVALRFDEDWHGAARPGCHGAVISCRGL